MGEAFWGITVKYAGYCCYLGRRLGLQKVAQAVVGAKDCQRCVVGGHRDSGITAVSVTVFAAYTCTVENDH